MAGDGDSGGPGSLGPFGAIPGWSFGGAAPGANLPAYGQYAIPHSPFGADSPGMWAGAGVRSPHNFGQGGFDMASMMPAAMSPEARAAGQAAMDQAGYGGRASWIDGMPPPRPPTKGSDGKTFEMPLSNTPDRVGSWVPANRRPGARTAPLPTEPEPAFVPTEINA